MSNCSSFYILLNVQEARPLLEDPASYNPKPYTLIRTTVCVPPGVALVLNIGVLGATMLAVPNNPKLFT